MSNHPFFSPSRITVIASNTFTQLVRMKVFYFMAVFTVLIIAASLFDMPYSRTTEDTAEQELIILKSTAMGSMMMFSMLFAVASTALLIPKDLEDRTLYTILSKPVPRLDYLLGKLAGVLLLIGISLMLMDGLLSLILHFKTHALIEQEMIKGHHLNWPKEYLEIRKSSIAEQGLTWNLQAGISAIFYKSAIMASIALLISTFSSSTLFTIIISVVVYFIGHFTADARNIWLQSKGVHVTEQAKFLSRAVALIFPDFQQYNIIDASIEGKKIPWSIFQRLSILTFFYTAIYSVLSWFTFRKKEF